MKGIFLVFFAVPFSLKVIKRRIIFVIRVEPCEFIAPLREILGVFFIFKNNERKIYYERNE